MLRAIGATVGKERKGPLVVAGGKPQHLSMTAAHSQVELCELCAHHIADHVADVVGNVSTRAPGFLSLFIRDDMAKISQPGGDGKPDAVHEGGDGGQGPADNGVQREHYAAESQEEGADGFPQRVCPGFGKCSAKPRAQGEEEQQRGGGQGGGVMVGLTQTELEE